jgi:hypothetical protein
MKTLEPCGEKYVKFGDRVIDPLKIENRRIARVLRERFTRNGQFMFFYRDNHTDHNETVYQEHTEHVEQETYDDYGDRYDVHTEENRHTDNHTDHTRGVHTDSVYGDAATGRHTDEYPYHTDEHTDHY